MQTQTCFIPSFHFQVSALGAEFSSEACRELGFSSNLLCSSCDLLGQFNLLPLDPVCRGCCQEEAQFETKKVLVFALSFFSVPQLRQVKYRLLNQLEQQSLIFQVSVKSRSGACLVYQMNQRECVLLPGSTPPWLSSKGRAGPLTPQTHRFTGGPHHRFTVAHQSSLHLAKKARAN